MVAMLGVAMMAIIIKWRVCVPGVCVARVWAYGLVCVWGGWGCLACGAGPSVGVLDAHVCG